MSVAEDIIKALQFQEREEYAKSEFFFQKALMSKDFCPPEVYIGLGVTYEKMNKIEEAIISYQKAIKLDDTLYESYNNLANVYLGIDENDLAIVNYKKAIILNPNDFEIYNNLAKVLNKQNFHKEAMKILKQYYKIEKKNFVILNNIGFTYLKLKKHEKALKYLFKALDIKENDEICNNISTIYIKMQKYKKAKKYAIKTLELNPSHMSGYVNLGISYEKTNKLKKAIQTYKKAKKININHVDVNFNLGFTYLFVKNYKLGFKYYEARRLKSNFMKFTNVAKIWEDENLDNKKLLITREQGMGDTIQFLRYLELLDKNNIKYSLLVQEPLKNLIQYNFPNINVNESCNDIDYTFPLMSLPNKFSITNVNPINKYLTVDVKDLERFSKFFDKTKFNIGIVWQGSSLNPDNVTRSIKLSNFYGLSKISNVQLYSLQVENDRELNDVPKDINIINLRKNFTDFYDTASAIKNLDLVISVCTSVVHLSGALGVKTFAIVSYHPDWRWGLGTDKSDWYKNMKVFRQPKNLKWKQVFSKVINEIKKL